MATVSQPAPFPSICPKCVNPSRGWRPRPANGEIWLGDHVYATGQSIHRVIKAIFDEVRLRGANSPAPVKQKYYLDNFSNSTTNMSRDGGAHRRPCILLEDISKEQACVSVRMCYMGTFSRTAYPEHLPSILRLFVCPIAPHVSLDKINVHFHTDPEWHPGKNMWLVLYRHWTTSQYMTTLWPPDRDNEDNTTVTCHIFAQEDIQEIYRLCGLRLQEWLLIGSNSPLVVTEWWTNYENWRRLKSPGSCTPVDSPSQIIGSPSGSTSSLPNPSAVLHPAGSYNASRVSLSLQPNLPSSSHDSLTGSPTESRSLEYTSSATHVSGDSTGQPGGAPKFPKAYSKAHLGPRQGSTYSSDSGSGSPSGSYNAQLRDLVTSQHTPPLAWTSRNSSPSGSSSQLLPARSASPQTSQWSPGATTFNSRTSGTHHAGAPSSLSLPGAGFLPSGGKDKAAYSSMPSLPAPSLHGSSRAPSVNPFSYASIAARGRVESGQRSSAPSVTASTPSVSSDRPYGQGSSQPTVNLNLDADADPWMQTMVSATSLDAPQHGTGDGPVQGDTQPQTTPDGTSGHGRSAMSRLASSLSFGTRKKKRATKTK